MTTTDRGILNLAAMAGGYSRDAYWDEFEETPLASGKEAVGDWDSSAWQIAWHELKDHGATDADYAACRDEWRRAFWNIP